MAWANRLNPATSPCSGHDSDRRRRAAGIFILGAPGSGKHVLQSLFERLATKYNLNVVIEAVKPGEAVEDLSPSDVVLLLYDVASAVALSTLPAAAMADGFNHRKTVLVGNKIDLEYYRRVSCECLMLSYSPPDPRGHSYVIVAEN